MTATDRVRRTTDPYATNVPYEPTDPNAPAVGGYATTGTGTYTTESYGTDTGIGGGSPSTKDVAKDEAGNVKDTAVDAGKQVAGTAKQEAANVAGEAKQQAKSLVGAATIQLKDQASSQQNKLATSLRGYTDQLQGLTQGQALEAGPLNDLVQQAASRANQFVSRLENTEPADLLDDVRRFARRHPVTFLALCGLAGVVAGRITRGAVAANTSVDSRAPPGRSAARPARRTPPPVVPTTPRRPAPTVRTPTLRPAATPPRPATRPRPPTAPRPRRSSMPIGVVTPSDESPGRSARRPAATGCPGGC